MCLSRPFFSKTSAPEITKNNLWYSFQLDRSWNEYHRLFLYSIYFMTKLSILRNVLETIPEIEKLYFLHVCTEPSSRKSDSHLSKFFFLYSVSLHLCLLNLPLVHLRHIWSGLMDRYLLPRENALISKSGNNWPHLCFRSQTLKNPCYPTQFTSVCSRNILDRISAIFALAMILGTPSNCSVQLGGIGRMNKLPID